jgi:uncharacterized membrane protein
MCRTVLALAAMALIAGCAGLTETQQRGLTGAAGGAAAGSLIGAIAGDAGMGAAIGAGTGLVGGLIVDKVERDRRRAYEQGYRDAERAY